MNEKGKKSKNSASRHDWWSVKV